MSGERLLGLTFCFTHCVDDGRVWELMLFRKRGFIQISNELAQYTRFFDYYRLLTVNKDISAVTYLVLLIVCDSQLEDSTLQLLRFFSHISQGVTLVLFITSEEQEHILAVGRGI